MSDTLIQQHTSWRHLLRALTNHHGWLRSHVTEDLQKGLVVPVAVARWISVFAPALANKTELTLVLGGAEQGAEYAAGGRWYHLIPTLLGNPAMKLKVVLVGPHASGTSSKERHAPPTLLTNRPWQGMPPDWTDATLVDSTLGAYFEKLSVLPDLVLLPHPGFEVHQESWLTPGELADVLETKVPVGAFSYALDEFEMERWLLDVHGYAVSPQFEVNPLQLSPDEEIGLPVAIAAVLWKIDAAPAFDFEADPDVTLRYSSAMALIEDMFTEGEGHLVVKAGSPLPRHPDMLFVPPLFAVSLVTGGLYAQVGEDVEDLACQIPEELMAHKPGPDSLPFERTLFALEATAALRVAMALDLEQ